MSLMAFIKTSLYNKQQRFDIVELLNENGHSFENIDSDSERSKGR